MQVECFPDAPEEWTRELIGDVASVNPKYRLDKDKAYPFVEMANVAENFGGIIQFDWRKPESSGLSRFKLDDILFGKITPCAENGKIALVKELSTEFGLGSTEFIVLSPKPANAPRFIYALVSSHPVHGRVVTRMEGSTGRLRITEDTFTKLLVVPKPPRTEQEGIARILDAVDGAIERTRVAVAKAERLQQAAVAHAFREFGSTKRRLGEFITDIRYGTSQAANESKWGYPTLRIPNVIGNTVNTNDLVYVDASEKDAQRFVAKANDLLLVRTNGNPNYVGRSAIFAPPDERHWLYASYLIRVRFTSEVNADYVNEFLNAEIGRRELFRRVTTSAGNYNINTQSVRAIPIPVVEPDKQAELVRLSRAARHHVATLVQKQIVLEQVKRGLLQDLLTGRVRVKS